MHISKNVCKSLLEHLTGVRNISKERSDLKDSNTKRELWDRHLDERGRLVYPIAPYTIERRHRSVLYSCISSIRTPSHFGAVLANAFTKKDTFSGLKSHDFFNILRYQLPLAIRGLLSSEVGVGVSEAIFRLSRFMRYVCLREISPRMMANLEKEAAVVVVLLQMQLPPSFFDSQPHLLVHLPAELKLAGPVQLRWMYPVERYIKVLKGFVR
jgi:hypothetical protein